MEQISDCKFSTELSVIFPCGIMDISRIILETLAKYNIQFVNAKYE